jgi:hypothetical protein
VTLRLPSFLIIGAMRSGTTSLHRYLLEHPAVFLPRAKEMHFFDDRYNLGLEWYASQFSIAGPESRIGEATPNYMHDPVALDRISKIMPEARLVVILRNPVDRAYSHYWHNRARGREPLSFEEAIAAEPERLARSRQDRRTYSYVDRGRYYEQLMMIRDRLPNAHVFVCLFDDLVRDPRSLFAGLCEFLGVDDQVVPTQLGQQVNYFLEFRSIQIRQLSKRLPRPIGRVVGRLNVRKAHAKYDPLSADTRAWVQDMLAEDIVQTAVLIERDLAQLWLTAD